MISELSQTLKRKIQSHCWQVQLHLSLNYVVYIKMICDRCANRSEFHAIRNKIKNVPQKSHFLKAELGSATDDHRQSGCRVVADLMTSYTGPRITEQLQKQCGNTFTQLLAWQRMAIDTSKSQHKTTYCYPQDGTFKQDCCTYRELWQDQWIYS